MKLQNLKTFYCNLSKKTKAFFWFTFCNFILQGITFISAPIFSRLLSTNQYGYLSTIMTYQQLFMIIATFEFSSGTYQRGLVKYEDEKPFFTSLIQVLSSVTVLVWFIVFMIFRRQICSFTEIPFFLFCLMFIFFMFNPAYSCWINEKRFSYNYRPACIMTVMYSLCSTVVSVIVVAFIMPTAVMKVTSMLCVQILFSIPFYIKNIKKSIIKKPSVLIKNIIIESFRIQVPLVLHSLSYLVLGQSDRIMISKMANNEDVAMYSVAYNIGVIIIIAQQSVNLVLRPWRYEIIKERNYRLLKKNTNILISVFAVIFILFMLIAPDILILLFGNRYREAVMVLPPIVLSVYFILLYSIFTDIETYLGKTQYIAIVSISCAILNFILNWIVLQYFTYVSCAYTTLICYILFAIFHYIFMSRMFSKKDAQEIIDVKHILIISILLCFVFAIITFFYHSNFIRHIVFCIILGLGIMKRKAILKACKIIMRGE